MDHASNQHRGTGLYGQRRSRCADAARELHIERTWMLAPIERIRLALSLGRRLRRLRCDPDPDDPLGGVLTVTGDDFDAVQVVNFYNPWAVSSNPGESSIQSAAACIPGYDLPVVDVPHLIALKLYAGGPRNRGDVLELIERNRDVDRSDIRRVCEQFNLTADIDEMLRDV